MGELLTYAALLALASLAMLPALLLRRRPSGYRSSTRRPTTPHPRKRGANYVGQPSRLPPPRSPAWPTSRGHFEAARLTWLADRADEQRVLDDIAAVADGRWCNHTGTVRDEDSGQVECIACGQVLQRPNPPPPEATIR